MPKTTQRHFNIGKIPFWASLMIYDFILLFIGVRGDVIRLLEAGALAVCTSYIYRFVERRTGGRKALSADQRKTEED